MTSPASSAIALFTLPARIHMRVRSAAKHSTSTRGARRARVVARGAGDADEVDRVVCGQLLPDGGLVTSGSLSASQTMTSLLDVDELHRRSPRPPLRLVDRGGGQLVQ
jgi:hypothetical protein